MLMSDPKIRALTRKIQKRGGCQVPSELIVREGQVRFLSADLWTNLEFCWRKGTPCLVLTCDGEFTMQYTDDVLDIMMPDGTVEELRVKWVI